MQLIGVFLIFSTAVVAMFLVGPELGKRTHSRVLKKKIPWSVQILILVLIWIVVSLVGGIIIKNTWSDICREHATPAEVEKCEDGLFDALRAK